MHNNSYLSHHLNEVKDNGILVHRKHYGWTRFTSKWMRHAAKCYTLLNYNFNRENTRVRLFSSMLRITNCYKFNVNADNAKNTSEYLET